MGAWEATYTLMIRSQSFSEHVLLDCELSKEFQYFSPHLGDRLELDTVFPFPQVIEVLITPAG